MTVIGAMRIRNEERWIERSIRSFFPICEKVIVLDDHSTDSTVDICRSIEGVDVISSPFEGLDETRDKNFLLDAVGYPDWCCMWDGDEELMPGAAARLQLAMQAATAQNIRALAFSVLYLWDRPDQIRVDGVYRSMSRVSAFRAGPERFESKGKNGFHCGNAPQAIQGRVLVNAPLLHYGYMDRCDRIRKYKWYKEQDPSNYIEDEYRHIVIGDMFPADSHFMHGGPLELRKLINYAQ